MNPMMKRLVLSLVVALASLACLPQAGAQSFSDTLIEFGPGWCAPSVSANFSGLAAAGAGTGPAAVGTAFIPAVNAASSAAATDTISCDLSGPTRSTAGKGLSSIAGVAFFYGIVTTTATSESAPACVSINMPVPATGETASTAAGTSVAVTSIPVVGSANLTAITTGQFYTTYLAFTTPPALPVTVSGGLYSKVICAFAFGQTAASAMLVNSPGGIVFTTNTIAWMKKHGHNQAVDAMMHTGVSRETSELVYVKYVPKDKLAQGYLASYFVRHPEAVEPMNARSRWPMLFTQEPAVASRESSWKLKGSL